ncbi:D-aminoacyl-tRNA deacylase [Melioribacteraceae bacterium 4301-Me]|uniref:D-aminoacyl-tRNA deacylase n=1 Tax=Pyranulibacter aquaticus TaxID=3163344 RepID=UPI003596F1D0
MRALVQRVSEGAVKIKKDNYYQEIKKGLVILLGVKEDDTESDAIFLADKCTNLRIFEDGNQKMNISVKDINGDVLIISQFTLYADASKGNRPSFVDAAEPKKANDLYLKFVQRVKNNLGEEKVKTGIFGEMMEVKIINDGPVTILVESKGK